VPVGVQVIPAQHAQYTQLVPRMYPAYSTLSYPAVPLAYHCLPLAYHTATTPNTAYHSRTYAYHCLPLEYHYLPLTTIRIPLAYHPP
jgi:hypothetical protein